jgi:hypothetical protein
VTSHKGWHESAEACHAHWQLVVLDLVVDPEESGGREAEAPSDLSSTKGCENGHRVAEKDFLAKLVRETQ